MYTKDQTNNSIKYVTRKQSQTNSDSVAKGLILPSSSNINLHYTKDDPSPDVTSSENVIFANSKKIVLKNKRKRNTKKYPYLIFTSIEHITAIHDTCTTTHWQTYSRTQPRRPCNSSRSTRARCRRSRRWRTPAGINDAKKKRSW